VATTCAATGVLGPIPVPGARDDAKQAANAKPAHVRADASASVEASTPIAPRGGAAVRAIEAQAVPDATSPPPRDTTPTQAPATATVTPTTTTTESVPTSPLEPSTPPVQQQFGVPAASSASSPAPVASSTSASALSSGGSVSESVGGGAAQQEFGP
jgi:hypothetical protein